MFSAFQEAVRALPASWQTTLGQQRLVEQSKRGSTTALILLPASNLANQATYTVELQQGQAVTPAESGTLYSAIVASLLYFSPTSLRDQVEAHRISPIIRDVLLPFDEPLVHQTLGFMPHATVFFLGEGQDA